MTLATDIKDYINAGFSGHWIQTSESDEAEKELRAAAAENDWKIISWDVASGLHGISDDKGGDPLAPLRALPALADGQNPAILIMHNFHRFINSPEVMQTTLNQLLIGKSRRAYIIAMSPIVTIPIELEKLFVVVEHSLPDKEQLAVIAQDVDDEAAPEAVRAAVEAAAGLTRYEAEGAFALSVARDGGLSPKAVAELKAASLKKTGLLTLYQGEACFKNLGGMDNLKKFCLMALDGKRKVAKPRGILMLSPPGCGKSEFCKALGNETGRPTLSLDVGSMYGSLVGATEQNVRQALRIADAMAPCVLFIDEIDKALSGVGSSGDSGVATRLFGTILTWLSDHTTDVFVTCTANDISKLPPEFSRAERFDGIFFLDLPNVKEKDPIWAIYSEMFGIGKQSRPDDTSWTGAEIKACCRLASLLNVPLTQAARNIVPVAVTSAESVERLRSWASGRCLSSGAPGIYKRGESVDVVSEKSGKRKVIRQNPRDN